MAEQLTLIAYGGLVPAAERAMPAGYRLRGCRPEDAEQLGRLYFESYEPGRACANLPEAVADIQVSFTGGYGELWPAASVVATHEQQIVAAILVVKRAPWSDTPDCPFAIELFTAPAHRRRGLARNLVLHALQAIAGTGPRQLALRVSADNHAARTLYHSLGFITWSPL